MLSPTNDTDMMQLMKLARRRSSMVPISQNDMSKLDSIYNRYIQSQTEDIQDEQSEEEEDEFTGMKVKHVLSLSFYSARHVAFDSHSYNVDCNLTAQYVLCNSPQG